MLEGSFEYRWNFGISDEFFGDADRLTKPSASFRWANSAKKDANPACPCALLPLATSGVQGRAFKMENYFADLKVSQILEHRYEGEAFCGADAIVHGFSQLEPIFMQNKSDWKSALENVKGVYLVTDTSNGKMYVGSAYGDTGIWSRWSCYINSGHGWNEGLKEVINKHGLDYARKNFQFALLEIFTMKTDDRFIIDREQHWKNALLTRTFGYNRN